MKKLALSSSNTKSAEARRRLRRRVATPAISKKAQRLKGFSSRARTRRPKQRRPTSRRRIVRRGREVRRAFASSETLTTGLAAVARAEPEAISLKPLPPTDSADESNTAPRAEETDHGAGGDVEKAWLEPRAALPKTAASWRQQVMWAGVGLSMFAIVVAWAWTLRYSLQVPPVESVSPVPMTNMSDDFSALYQQVNRSLDRFQAIVPPVPAKVQPSTVPALTPEQLERLRQKLESATGQPVPPSAGPSAPVAPAVGPNP